MRNRRISAVPFKPIRKRVRLITRGVLANWEVERGRSMKSFIVGRRRARGEFLAGTMARHLGDEGTEQKAEI